METRERKRKRERTWLSRTSLVVSPAHKPAQNDCTIAPPPQLIRISKHLIYTGKCEQDEQLHKTPMLHWYFHCTSRGCLAWFTFKDFFRVWRYPLYKNVLKMKAYTVTDQPLSWAKVLTAALFYIQKNYR